MIDNATKPDQTSSRGRRDNGSSINYANEMVAEYSTTSPDGSSNSTFLEPPANHISTQDGVYVSVKDELSSESARQAQESVTAETGETGDGKTAADLVPSKEVSYCLDRPTRNTPESSEKDSNSEALDRRQRSEGNANRHSTSYTNLSKVWPHSTLVSSSSPQVVSSSPSSLTIGLIEGEYAETRRISSPTSSSRQPSLSSSAESCTAIEPVSTSQSINVQTEVQLFQNPSPSITSSSSSTSPLPLYRTSGEILSTQKVISPQPSSSSSSSSSPTAVNSIPPQILAQPAVGLPQQFVGHTAGTQLEIDQALLQRPGNVVFLVLQNRHNSKQLIQLAGFTSLEELQSDRTAFPGYLIVDQLQVEQFEQVTDSSLEGSLDLTVRKQQPLTPERVNERSASKYDSTSGENGAENLSSRDSGRQRNSTSLEPTAVKHQNAMMPGSHLASLANVSMAGATYFSQSSVSSLPSPLPQTPSSSVMPAYALFVPPAKLSHQGHLVLSKPPSLPSPAPQQTPSASLQSPNATPNASSLTTSSKQFTCNICGKMYNSEKYLSMHVSIHNPSMGGLQQKLPTFVEKKCSVQSDGESYADVNSSKKSFSVLNPSASHTHDMSLKIHFAAGTETISNAADLDSQRNFVKGKPNVKVMAGGGQWKCKLCDKFFAQNSNYKNHMRTHSNERPYLCEICSIGFKERYHLKKHVLFKHSDEAKEQCRVCGKRFKDSTAVRAHERTHSNDRPYSCPRCHKSFKTSECLWHHENRSKTCGKTAAANATKVEAQAPIENSQLTSPSPCKQPRRKKLDVPVNPRDIIEEMPSIPLSTGADDYVEHYAQSHQIHPAQQHSSGGDNLTRGEMQQEQLYYIHHHQHQMVYRQLSQTPLSGVTFNQDDQKTYQHVQQKHLIQLQENVETKPHVEEAVSSQPISYLKVNGKSPVVVYKQSPEANMNTPSWNVSSSFTDIKNGEGFNQRSDIQDHYIYERQDSSNSLSGIKFEDPFQLNDSYLNNVDGTLDASVGSTGEKLFVIERSSKQRFGDEEGKIIFSQGELHVAHEVECLEEVGEVPPADGNENFQDSGKAEMTGFSVSYDYPQQMMDNKSHIEIQDASTSLQNNEFYPPPPSSLPYNSYQQRTNQSELVQQISNAESERPFKCDICQSGFKLKVHLKKHQLYKHSDDYPCECKFCGKRFKDSSAVKLHERTHSEERPFSCECGKSFKTRENLWGHKHRGPCDYNNSNKDLKTAVTCLLAGSKAYGTNGNIVANPGLSLTQTNFGDNKLEPDLNFSQQTVVVKEVQKLRHLEAFAAVEQNKFNEDKSQKDSQAVYYDKCLVAAIQQQQLQPMDQADSSVNVNQSRKRSSLPTFDSKSQLGSAELMNSGESRASSKSTSNILATSLPTAVVVPIKRKKTEMTQVDVQAYNFPPSISTSINAPGVPNVPLGSPTPRTGNSTLIPIMTSPQNVYMSSSNLHFGNGMRILNGHNITYQAAVDRSSAAQLPIVNRNTKGGMVLPNHVEVLLDTKPSLPPFESLLFQAEQSRYQHQANQMNSSAFNGLVQNLCSTNDNGVATLNSQLVYTANPRVVLTAPRSVQK